MNNVLFDFARTARTGLPEAVFCQGKPFESLLELFKTFQKGTPPVLFTRLEASVFQALPKETARGYNYDPLSRTAYNARMPKRSGSVALVSAGTADSPVLHEAARTLEYLGVDGELFEDCGVAGLWRLVDRIEAINAHDAVIVAAGLDAALASVVGGLTPLPIFAVPTSVGYGMAEGGRSALNSMLCSCAPGICIFNIDNGYGAACAAVRSLNMAAKKRVSPQAQR